MQRRKFLFSSLLLAAAGRAGAQQPLKPWPGVVTPPLELADLDGKTHRLADYRGKAVLLNFWATWCEPCREEMPSIERLREQLAGKPFAVLAVNVGESAEKARAFATTMPIGFPLLLDRDIKVSRAWGARVLLNFWATWCEPCREEMPSIERLREQLAGKPFAVLAVNVGESAEKARAFATTMPIGFPLLLDRDIKVSRAWGARVLPATYLIGADGVARFSYLGQLDWAKPEVRAVVEKLMR